MYVRGSSSLPFGTTKKSRSRFGPCAAFLVFFVLGWLQVLRDISLEEVPQANQNYAKHEYGDRFRKMAQRASILDHDPHGAWRKKE
jgi:hypothetical protein